MMAEFYNISEDITDPNINLQSIFDYMQSNNEMFGSEASPPGTFDLTFTDQNHPLLLAIQNSLNADRFTLGIRECIYCWDHYWAINTPTVKLKIEFTPPEHLVTINQKLNNNQQVGLLRKWEEGSLSFSAPFNPGSQFSFQVFSHPVLLGDQNLMSNQKYHDWDNDRNDVKNHHICYITETTEALNSNFIPINLGITIKNNLEGTGIDGGSVQFKDPWFIDYPDVAYGGTLRNGGMDQSIFHNRTSPFIPNTTTPYENGKKYNGVFLDQSGPGNNWQDTYYSVGSPSEQTIPLNGNDHKFFFQSYTYDPNKISLQYPSLNQTGVVFKTSDAIVTANLKGQLISNEGTGFSSNGQRKIVRDNSGYYHCVYSSQDVVWYTKSTTTNFDGNWSQDAEIFLNNSYDKNSSIDVNGTDYALVAELQDGNYSSVFLYRSETSSLDEVATIDNSYYGTSYPVISKTNNEYFIIYKTSATSSLKYRRYYQTSVAPYTWVWTPEADLPFSTSNSKYPSITGIKDNDDVYIVWQEGTSEIKYLYSHRQGNNRTFYSSDFQSVSANSGYTTNINPSISLSGTGVVVSWTGSRKESVQSKVLGKENLLTYVHRALVRVKASSWGDFLAVGTDVNFTNNNSSTSSSGETVIAFSQNGGQSAKWLKRVGAYYSEVGTLSHNGLQVNVSNGTGLVNQKALVFNTSSLPYPINRSTTSFTSLSKIASDKTITYGRTGIVGKQALEFIFCVEDILLEDQNIKFTERVDTLPVVNLNELNSATRTGTFNLNGNSNLYFSLYYLVINPELASPFLQMMTLLILNLSLSMQVTIL